MCHSVAIQQQEKRCKSERNDLLIILDSRMMMNRVLAMCSFSLFEQSMIFQNSDTLDWCTSLELSSRRKICLQTWSDLDSRTDMSEWVSTTHTASISSTRAPCHWLHFSQHSHVPVDLPRPLDLLLLVHLKLILEISFSQKQLVCQELKIYYNRSVTLARSTHKHTRTEIKAKDEQDS